MGLAVGGDRTRREPNGRARGVSRNATPVIAGQIRRWLRPRSRSYGYAFVLVPMAPPCRKRRI